MMIQMIIAKCIACNQDIILGAKPRKWTFVTCQHCGTKLEIIRVNPPLLDWPLTLIEDEDDTFYRSHQSVN